jgi:hypothetical protein
MLCKRDAMAVSCMRCVFVLGAVFAFATACNRGDEVTHPIPDEPPASRAAASFVHCVEAGSSACIKAQQTSGGWDALHLLSWLGSGSPAAIIQTLPRQLATHTQRDAVQGRFVDAVERYSAAIRGAECDAVQTQEAGPLVDKASQTAVERLEGFGLFNRSMAKVVEGLAGEAHEELDGGHIVHMNCKDDPYRVYLAVREGDGGEQIVVGFTTYWPEYLGGELPSREVVEERLHSRWLGLGRAGPPIAENTIHPWLPLPIEEF